jgi:hypothetical protein
MKSTNNEVLLRNRRVFANARDAAFGDAGKLIDEILAHYGENGVELVDPDRLKKLIAALVDRLFHARYFARLSVGGNNVDLPPEIDHVEQAYIDHVETTYSYSRSINRFVRHELLIDSFTREHPDVSEDLKAYLREIRKSDANLIYANLRSLRERMRVFVHFMNHPPAFAAVRSREPSDVLQGGPT